MLSFGKASTQGAKAAANSEAAVVAGRTLPICEREPALRPLSEILEKIKRYDEKIDSLLKNTNFTPDQEKELRVLVPRVAALKWTVGQGWLL